MQVQLKLPQRSPRLCCSPIVVLTKASHRFNQRPKKCSKVSEASRKCLNNDVFSPDPGLASLQLLGSQRLLLAQQGASGVGVLAVVKRHVVDALHVRLQVPFLRGSVWAELAAERPLPWGTHTQNTGLAHRGREGAERRHHAKDQDRKRCSGGDLTRQTVKTTDGTLQGSVKGKKQVARLHPDRSFTL